uniref:Uncharacterized protein n=2 Tax=Aegilops tauschii subsp. strangulata TaxID=200361 RepID=A0A453MYG4_AEGTS
IPPSRMNSKVGEMLPAAAPPLDDENLLSEILLRIPPLPSSLPRASLVCKRWRRIVSDTRFLRRFRLHHRRCPPLLGYFIHDRRGISYAPAVDSPDRVPAGRFSFQLDDSHSFCLLGCCHGLALIFLASRKQVLVWDPVTSDQHRIAVPSVFDVDENPIHGAVLRAAGEVGHFQVVLVEASGVDEQHTRMVACVYSSETGVWGNLTSTSVQPEGTSSLYFTGMPSVLVGSSLYMPLVGDFVGILEFNLERHSLAVIQVPVDMFESDINFAVMRGDGAGLGLIILSGCNAQLWKRETDFDGVASWGMRTTIELDKLLSLHSEKERGALAILGFAEENNVVFLSAVDGVFMVQLEPLQFKKLHVSRNWLYHYPFESVYTAGI